jgi:thermostable 8-oxoguanine DNA glycosylase
MSDFKIDPYKITDYHRNKNQLETFFLFCTAVAGKKATMISDKIYDFLEHSGFHGSPLERVKSMLEKNELTERLKRVSMGKYGLLTRSWHELTRRPKNFLNTAGVEELEELPAVGPKTARYFIVHSRPNTRLAVVDTHMLKFLRDMGHDDIPSGNAASPRHYADLEAKVLAHADKAAMSPQDFDLAVWTWYSKGNRGKPDFISG